MWEAGSPVDRNFPELKVVCEERGVMLHVTNIFYAMMYVKVETHPTARNQAVSTQPLPAGSIILSNRAFATVLFENRKGRRCDHCLVLSEILRKCSGCASCCYCDTNCQTRHWPSHKKLCKRWNSFTSSNKFQALPPHERLDSSMARTALYNRFGNNNFTIHSHLNSFAHGIFPLASRLFNHSCAPNAAARYKLVQGQAVTMEVVALRDIPEGEEICIPYLDPALLQTRQQIFQLTYGFQCTCISCEGLKSVGPIPEVPQDPARLVALEYRLRTYVGVDDLEHYVLRTKPITQSLPPEISYFLKEDYIEHLSGVFGQSSHDGPYDRALESGVTLLAIYLLIYSENYPQIGVHALELAKTAWNASMPTNDIVRRQHAMAQVRACLSVSRRILGLYGPEGDGGGPLAEITTLQQLIDQEGQSVSDALHTSRIAP
ncbi:SET domain-containing protein [Pleurotus eryngii]|uniref:SET domain-containing protein n=1 Tax=Pleurotus eryngii TaxID=5323 RepID=A0A9P5ZRJ8_PLEER|nr:SET domain-containing protein [Pleurotus eryngii]